MPTLHMSTACETGKAHQNNAGKRAANIMERCSLFLPLYHVHPTLTKWRVVAEQDEQDHAHTPHVDSMILHSKGAKNRCWRYSCL
jgi:hypothetical protein